MLGHPLDAGVLEPAVWGLVLDALVGQLEVAFDDGQVVSAGEGEAIGRDRAHRREDWARVAGREGIAEEIPVDAPPTSEAAIFYQDLSRKGPTSRRLKRRN